MYRHCPRLSACRASTSAEKGRCVARLSAESFAVGPRMMSRLCSPHVSVARRTDTTHDTYITALGRTKKTSCSKSGFADGSTFAHGVVKIRCVQWRPMIWCRSLSWSVPMKACPCFAIVASVVHRYVTA